MSNPESRGSEKQDILWDYFQNEGVESFAYSEGRLSFLAPLLPRSGPVLNIGVGNGMLEGLATSLGVEVYSLDPNERALERIRCITGHPERAVCGYAERLPFETSFFSAVVMSEVLEHLRDESLSSALPEILRVLRPGGLFLGTTPADEDIGKQTVVCPKCGHSFHRWGHVQSFKDERLHKLLRDGGFQPVQVSRKIFTSWSTLNWKGKVSAVVKRALFAIGVHGANESLFFRARKGKGSNGVNG